MTRFAYHMLIVGLLAAPATVLAERAEYPDSHGSFWSEQEQGWFFYEPFLPEQEDVPIEEPDRQEVPEPAPAPSAPTQTGPDVFSAAWMRENMQVYLDRAIDNPTEENLRAYALLQRVMLDRSTQFADRMVSLVEGDALLDEQVRRPFNSAAVNQIEASVERGIRESMHYLGENDQIGIWYFYSADCGHCGLLTPILAVMRNLYSLPVMAISMDGEGAPPNTRDNDPFTTSWVTDAGQSRALEVTRLPAVYMVYPHDEVVVPLAFNSLSRTELESRIVREAHALGVLPDELWRRTRQYDTTVPSLADADGSGVDEDVDWSDPTALSEYLQSLAFPGQSGDQ